jgi:hypothetical protein
LRRQEGGEIDRAGPRYEPGCAWDGSPSGGDVPDDRFGKPDHKLFQLAVLAVETVQCLFELGVPVSFIETMRPSLLGSKLLHRSSLDLERTVTIGCASI